MIEFKGTDGDYEIVEHNWSDTSIMCNGKTICRFELAESDLTEEENSYNIKLISKAPEMLDLLQYFVDEDMLSHAGDELAIKLIKQATEL